MIVRILRPALEDLAAGREFYNRQREGVGSYFSDSLFAEIDSLVLYAGIHRMQFGYHRLLAKRFGGVSDRNGNGFRMDIETDVLDGSGCE